MEMELGRPRREGVFFNLLGRGRAAGRMIAGQIGIITSNRLGRLGLAGLTLFLCLAIFAPVVAPYDPYDNVLYPDGKPVSLERPSLAHPLGTTLMSNDVLSQLIWGTRRTIVIGFAAAVASALIGTNLGLMAGYYGGNTDNILMRLTDAAYGIPFLPFAMVALATLGNGDIILIIIMASIGWRTTARVIRSQVLTLRERPFVAVAKSMGASSARIIYRHIAPNVLPLAILNTILFIGECVLVEASVSFLGFGNPESMSWGQMLFYCFSSQRMRTAWWWSVPPGLAIMLLVLSVFLVGRTYEEVINPRLREL